jgi:hypothetical protein
MDLRHPFTPQPQTMTARARVTGSGTRGGVELNRLPVNDIRDAAFLSELDASLSRASVPELRALDALTPRADDLPR